MGDSCAIQLIDEEKKFNENTLEYFKKCVENRDVGLNYHVISVFGSQSSGKSSLLNALFNTRFDIMNAQVKRQQTTKGIWIAHTRKVATTHTGREAVEQEHEYFVLDVEGSDGAERGEDKDFERKAALFALATSEVLLVNMWEQQVGLYQGNNMGLLKTVFEVNLSLFGHNKDKKKIMLLFVIRDFTGFTPLKSLSETLISELEAMWDELNKPVGAEDSSIYDFFDLDFIGLSHKLFKPEDFMKDVRQLGDRFIDEKDSNYYLKDSYHQGLPLDGWAYYAGSCWEQIENNKDLDLPTQQTLVARFKTEEIANLSYENFIDGFSQLSNDLSSPKLAASLKELRDVCLTEYDNVASRYMKDVYMEKRDELLERIQVKFVEASNSDILQLIEKLINEFKSFVSDKTNKKQFNEKTDIAYKKAVSDFTEQTADFLSLGILPSLKKEEELLSEKLDELVEQERTKEIKMLTIRAKKYLHNSLRDTVIQLLTHPTDDVWKTVMATFEETFSRSISKFTSHSSDNNGVETFAYDFHVGATPEVSQSIYKKIRSNAWAVLDEIIHQYLKEDNVVSIIRGVYESNFRYDDNDVPRLWKNEDEIDEVFKVARERALSVLNTLSIVTVDGAEVIPDEAIKVEEDYDDDGSYQEDNFAHVLNALQKQRIIQQFKRFANVTVIEAKRSIIKTTSHIPTWLYIMIVVLGWNEFMMVVRNPMFMTLLLLIASAVYVIHKLNLWKPLITFSNSALGETRSTIKNKLKGMLLDEHEPKLIPVKQNSAVESYELDDMKADASTNY